MADSGPRFLEVLSEDECRRLLAGRNLGRMAFVVDDEPQIFPVNYVADGSTVIFRTGEDTPLAKAAMRKVAFEIDDVDAEESAWSVIVRGVAEEITSAADRYATTLRSRPVVPLAPGKRERWMAIYPTDISGRRFRIE